MNVSSNNLNKEIAIPITKLNNYLGCKLCNGYFREAHTITECLHTFCRECLVAEFEKYGHRNKQCPTCNVSVGAAPKYIFDRTIQAIVDKIFPQFALEDKAFADGLRINSSPKRKNDSVRENNSTAQNKLPKTDLHVEDNEEKDNNETDGVESSIIIRVRPFLTLLATGSSDTSGSDNATSLVPPLPELTKPLLKATEKVKVTKVQKFIHKRLSTDISASLNSSDISIFYATTVTSILLDPSKTLQYYIASLNIPINQSDPITLMYKRKEAS